MRRRGNIEGARDQRAVARAGGGDQLQALGHVLDDAAGEGAVEPAPAPHQLVDGGAVQIEGGGGPARRLGAQLPPPPEWGGNAFLGGRGALARGLVARL